MKFFDPYEMPKQFNTTVGFEPILKRLAEMSEAFPKIPSYPPYNIKKTGENTYVIEMAVAGFGKQDIELTLDNGVLTVKGNTSIEKLGETLLDDYIYKGIADRSFTRQFTLADAIEVKNADLINGMLKVWLERFIPEEKQPKTIPIGEPAEVSTKQFLTEKVKE